VPKCRGRIEQPVPTELSTIIHRWSDRKNVTIESGKTSLTPFTGGDGNKPTPMQLVIPTDSDADRIFVAFDNDTIEYGKKHNLLACLWAKGEENARRIALILACSENFDAPRINASMADYACRLVKYILTDFSITIAPEIVFGEIDSRKRKIIKVIDKSGTDGIDKRDISRLTPEFTKKHRDDILIDLIESGELAVRNVDRSKTRTYHYWTASNYAKLLSK
jgi:hypothetical protein